MILDLRGNGGGFLKTAVDLADEFLMDGLQIVYTEGRAHPKKVYNATSRGSFEKNDMVVLIDEGSASASEILSAAIQDYKRGWIVGTPSYGKGTVQSFIDLDQLVPEHMASLRPAGSVKVTQQKFYRINGGSTQLKGVTPDVLLPDLYEYIDLGEKEMFNPLPWDQIKAVKYKVFKNDGLTEIRKKSAKRVQAQEGFEQLKKQALRVKSKKENTRVPLQLGLYRKQQQVWRDESKLLEDSKKNIPDFQAVLLKEDIAKLATDSVRKNRELKWAENLSKDLYLFEATQILQDQKK